MKRCQLKCAELNIQIDLMTILRHSKIEPTFKDISTAFLKFYSTNKPSTAMHWPKQIVFLLQP
jgi:hypothetical protein